MSWFTESNYNKLYIWAVNDTIVYDESIPFDSGNASYLEAGEISFPATIWVKAQPAEDLLPIRKVQLEWKKDGESTWNILRTINNPDWLINFDKPVPLFGRNILKDLTGISAGDKILIRIYATDNTNENASLLEDATEDGTNTWKDQWVVSLTVSENTRPVLLPQIINQEIPESSGSVDAWKAIYFPDEKVVADRVKIGTTNKIAGGGYFDVGLTAFPAVFPSGYPVLGDIFMPNEKIVPSGALSIYLNDYTSGVWGVWHNRIEVDPDYIDPSLVLHLKYVNDVPALGTWEDLSGNGNHGTLVGNAFVNKDGVNLDGTESHIILPDEVSVAGLSEVSLYMMVYLNDNNKRCIYGEGVGSGDYWRFAFENSYLVSGKITFSVRDTNSGDTGTRKNLTSSVSTPIQEWFLLGVSYSVANSLCEISINGETVASRTNTYPFTNTLPYYLRIGNDGNSGVSPANGYIDDIRIYNRALSAAETLQLYNDTKPNSEIIIDDSLVTYLKYTEDVPALGTWTDSSGNNNGHTLIGDAYVDIDGLHLDGSGDYTQFLGVMNIVSAGLYSIVIWFKETAYSSKHNILSIAGSPSASTPSMFARSQNGTLIIYGNGQAYVNTGLTFKPAGEWNYLCLKKVDNTVIVHVNNSDPVTIANSAGSNDNFYIGSAYAGTFNGTIGIVGLYNRTISTEESNTMYNDTKGNYE